MTGREERRSRVHSITASYFRKGKCARCGKSTERTRNFLGQSLAECNRQADAWMATPLLHRRCEVRP